MGSVLQKSDNNLPQTKTTFEDNCDKEMMSEQNNMDEINQFIKAIDKFGGCKGVEKILSESLHEHSKNKDYQKALDLLQPVFDIVRDCPLQSDETIKYVSFSEKFEWDIYRHYYPALPNQKIKNIDPICPINFILRQYALAALELGDTSTALSTISMGMKWNPVYAPYGLIRAMAHNDEKEWDKLLEDIFFCIKYAYTTQNLINGFALLHSYFIKQKMPNVDKNKTTREIMSECLKEYGVTQGFNPDIVAIAKSRYDEACLAGNQKSVKYYSSILSELLTKQEKANVLVRRQYIEYAQKHPNYALRVTNGDSNTLLIFSC